MTQRIILDGGSDYPVAVILEPHGVALCGRGRGGIFLNDAEGCQLMRILEERYGDKPRRQKSKSKRRP